MPKEISSAFDLHEVGMQHKKRFIGPSWLDSVVGQMNSLEMQNLDTLRLDLRGVEFINLYEWLSVIAHAETFLRSPVARNFEINLVGEENAVRMLTPQEFVQRSRGRSTERLTTADQFEFSKNVYRIAGFLEALDSSTVLNPPGRLAKLTYPFVGTNQASLRSFYVGSVDIPTVELPLTRIESKDDCRRYLDSKLILIWRSNMQQRFPEL